VLSERGIRAVAFRFLTIGGLLLLAACTPGPVREGAIANGVTREGMLKLRLGMSERQVVDLLGAPLGSTKHENRIMLEFARHKQLGDGDSAPPLSGISIAVVLSDDSLAFLSVLDVDASAHCTCTTAECSKDWLKACERHLPEARR
jgi:hypothetical protein